MEAKGSPLALGTENVWRLLMQYAIPSVIAMTAASLYNITDSIFIGQGVGALAISGLAITFPLMNLAAAFGALVGVGASMLMSLRLGQKDYSSANNILGNVFSLNLIFGITYTIVILSFLDPILYFFGASDDTITYAREYMQVITLGNVITHMYLGLNAMLRATGNPKTAMYTTIFSVVINAAITYVFIFVFNWGIRGAALGTVIAQASMLTWQIIIYSNKKNFIHLMKGSFRLKRKIVKDSLSIGLSPFLMNSVGCVLVIILNKSLIHYGGDLQVGAYGIVNRIAFLFGMIVMGLNMGMQPIAGYNFGAGQFDRVNRVLKYTIIIAVAVLTVGFLVCELFPGAVASMFTTDKKLIDMAEYGLRIVFMFAPIVSFQIVASNFFQSIGMVKRAVFLSLSRQALILLPCLLIMPLFLGLKGVWLSMPAADLLSTVIAAFMLVSQYKKFKIAQ
ncbi:MAG: MATE family efflux transporter [Bacteroidales bacterium]|nr:MATE family efflux transporter [Bacteroidales bacterium]